MIFGVSLNDYEYQRADKGYGQPPGIVLKCIAELDARGKSRFVVVRLPTDHNIYFYVNVALQMEGIHRINGRVASVQQVSADLNDNAP